MKLTANKTELEATPQQTLRIVQILNQKPGIYRDNVWIDDNRLSEYYEIILQYIGDIPAASVPECIPILEKIRYALGQLEWRDIDEREPPQFRELIFSGDNMHVCGRYDAVNKTVIKKLGNSELSFPIEMFVKWKDII